jgi:hypothetical protein
MNQRPTVEDIQSYLHDTGWRREPHTWHDASVWSNADGYQVLVPPRDDLADAELRVREILKVLTEVERRSDDEIIGDIITPFADTLTYRMFSDRLPAGFTSLSAGLRGLHGVRDMVHAAARTVVEGPRPAFLGATPEPVGELLQHVQLGPSRPGSYVLSVRVPHNGPPGSLLGRRVVRKLYDAVTAVRIATMQRAEADLAVFDETVSAGVSANLCEALSGLAGRERQQPFEVAFRWGRGLAADVPAGTVQFTTGMGSIISAAATRLRQLGVSGDGVVTGLVESLHDQAEGTDRWRIKVRGHLTARGDGGTNRTVWVRLGGQEAYDRAISAHKTKQRVRARGALSTLRGRIELIVSDRGFDVLD